MSDFTGKASEKCTLCGGAGSFEKDDGKTYECSCAILKRLAASMPVYVRTAYVDKQHIQLDIPGKIRSNLFIKAAWPDMKAIIKVAMYKFPALHFRLTSDREIRDVGVGSASRNARGEEAIIVYNSLQELMESPKLVIVRLNELGYKNKAAPGFLEEAISIRLDRGYPVWLLSDLNKPFGPGSFSYSEQLWDLIQSSFEFKNVPRIANPPVIQADNSGYSIQKQQEKSEKSEREKVHAPQVLTIEDSGQEKSDEKKSKFSDFGAGFSKQKERKIRSSPDLDADSPKVSVYGQGMSKKSKFRKSED